MTPDARAGGDKTTQYTTWNSREGDVPEGFDYVVKIQGAGGAIAGTVTVTVVPDAYGPRMDSLYWTAFAGHTSLGPWSTLVDAIAEIILAHDPSLTVDKARTLAARSYGVHPPAGTTHEEARGSKFAPAAAAAFSAHNRLDNTKDSGLQADEAEAGRLDEDAGRAPVARLHGGRAAERLRQAAAELRAGEPENVRVLLGDALSMVAWESHQAQGLVNGHLAWLADRYPPPRESHAERTRRLARDVRAAGEIPRGTRAGIAAELDGAAGHLAAERLVWAWHALTRASRPGGDEGGSPREAALRLRAAALGSGVRFDLYERLTAVRAADNDDLVHFRAGDTWHSVHGTALAAFIAEDCQAAGFAVTPGEAPTAAAMSAGAGDFRAHALDQGWDVEYVPSGREPGSGGIEEQVTARNRGTGETAVRHWLAGRPWPPDDPESPEEHGERIAASATAPKPGRRRTGQQVQPRARGRH